MQMKTFLAVFCVIATILLGVNDGAPTTKAAKPAKTTVVVVPDPPVVVASTPAVSIVPGKKTDWQTKIDAKSKKLFNDYKKIIMKKLRSVHKVAPSFKPKPEKVSTQVVSGILYHYLVRLPTKKYAHVTILERSWLKDQYGKEEHVTVRPELYPLDAKNI